jgi:Family of unknown function (DUF5678)
MATIPMLDLATLLKDIPRGAWVAISEDGKAVINYGADMRTVLEEAKEKGEPNPTILRVAEAASALML